MVWHALALGRKAREPAQAKGGARGGCSSHPARDEPTSKRGVALWGWVVLKTGPAGSVPSVRSESEPSLELSLPAHGTDSKSLLPAPTRLLHVPSRAPLDYPSSSVATSPPPLPAAQPPSVSSEQRGRGGALFCAKGQLPTPLRRWGLGVSI